MKIFQGEEAVEKLTNIVRTMTQYFSNCHIHYVANISSSVRRTEEDDARKIPVRAPNKEKTKLVLQRLCDLGITTSLYLSDSDFVSGIPVNGSNWSKPIQLVYVAGKFSSIDGARGLVPVIASMRSLINMNSSALGRILNWNKYIATQLLEAADVPTPKTWLYKLNNGWKFGQHPPCKKIVILKNNCEAFGLGVSQKSVMEVNDLESLEARCRNICEEIKCPELLVQEFVCGPEVYVPTYRLGNSFYVPLALKIDIESDNWKEGDPIGFDVNRLKKHTFSPYENAKIHKEISRYSSVAMEQLEIDILSRMDFRIGEGEHPKLFDTAETPGMGVSHAISRSLKEFDTDIDAWKLIVSLNVARYMNNY